MIEVREDVDLAQEPLGAECRGQLAAEYLHRDAPVVAQVPRQVHGRHRPVPHRALDVVPASERAPEPLNSGPHSARRCSNTGSPSGAPVVALPRFTVYVGSYAPHGPAGSRPARGAPATGAARRAGP